MDSDPWSARTRSAATERIALMNDIVSAETVSSARVLMPTEPPVSSMSKGSSASTPAARSRATTPKEMIQTASLDLTRLRLNSLETVSMCRPIRPMPRAIRNRSSVGE